MEHIGLTSEEPLSLDNSLEKIRIKKIENCYEASQTFKNTALHLPDSYKAVFRTHMNIFD